MSDQFSGRTATRRYPKVISIAAPIAGADWTTTVPAGELWDVLSIFSSLTSAVAVANRAPRLQISDGNVVWLDIPSAAVQAASLTYRYVYVEGATLAAVSNGQTVGIPDLVLLPGAIIRVTTDNIQAADQWAATYVYANVTLIQGGNAQLDQLPELQGFAVGLVSG